jgi:hypothetical protein
MSIERTPLLEQSSSIERTPLLEQSSSIKPSQQLLTKFSAPRSSFGNEEREELKKAISEIKLEVTDINKKL